MTLERGEDGFTRVERFEYTCLVKFLKEHKGHHGKTGDSIGVNCKTIGNWIKRYKLVDYCKKCYESRWTTDPDYWGEDEKVHQLER